MARATRTINPLHFEDLEPHRFEDLVRQLAYGFRPWRSLEATGRLGNDGGVDIRGWEQIGGQDGADDRDTDDEAAADDREWRIQVKRQKTLGPADIRVIVQEAVPPDGPPPHGLIVAAACNVSADALAVLREEAVARGVVESHMWSNSHLEDSLFRPENDHLLFAYFGISIATKRRAELAELRRVLGLKRKVRAAIDDKKEEENRGLRQPMIVRDIEAAYPNFQQLRGQMRGYAPPWHAVTLKEIHPLGVVLERFHYEGIVEADGTWDIREDTRWWSTTSSWHYSHLFEGDDDPTSRQYFGGGDDTPEKKVVSEIRLIPWANVIEIDPEGDSLLSEPHLLCRYDGDEGPYIGFRVFHAYIGGKYKTLEANDRRPLFPVPAASATVAAKPAARRPRKSRAGQSE